MWNISFNFSIILIIISVGFSPFWCLKNRMPIFWRHTTYLVPLSLILSEVPTYPKVGTSFWKVLGFSSHCALSNFSIFLYELYQILLFCIQHLNNSVGIAFAFQSEGRGFDSPTFLFLLRIANTKIDKSELYWLNFYYLRKCERPFK